MCENRFDEIQLCEGFANEQNELINTLIAIDPEGADRRIDALIIQAQKTRGYWQKRAAQLRFDMETGR